MVEALGPGVGFARQTEAFSAAQPPPTPTPAPTVVPPKPTAAPQAPQPLPAPMPVRDQQAVWAMIAVLGLAVLGGVTSAVIRYDGRRR